MLQAQIGTASVGARLWVAVDQEGGYVQELQGTGFSTIPTALTQGTLSLSTLRGRALRWGRQLKSAGVNLDLAPVLDTVPARLGTANRPIGYYYREYAHQPRPVARHGIAFLEGMRSAGVQTTAKHFPGLGRVHRNTDTSQHVTDRRTSRHDSYLRPFQRAVGDNIPVVMVSSARYTKIDPHRIAAFSPTVMRGMLRRDLGFTGVIISDSLNAAALRSHPVATRAAAFIRAGGTMALVTQTLTSAPMITRVLHTARAKPRFHRMVNADALTILQAKHRTGLLGC
jgi:beta-N-acetylhexosaminidase